LAGPSLNESFTKFVLITKAKLGPSRFYEIGKKVARRSLVRRLGLFERIVEEKIVSVLS